MCEFHRIEVLPLNVLDNRKFEPVGRCHVHDDGRQRFSTGELAGAEPTFTHDEFEPAPRLTHDHGLQHTVLNDRASELRKAFRVEFSSWLIWIWID